MDSLVMKSGGWLLVALVAVMAMAASADFGSAETASHFSPSGALARA